MSIATALLSAQPVGPTPGLKGNAAHMAQFAAIARYYYSIGGRWSGKTYEVLAENITEALANPKLRITACRKTYSSIRRSLYDDFILVLSDFGLQADRDYKTTTSPLYIEFPNGSNIIFMGIDTTDKAKGISGSHRLILEELNEYTEQDFETLDMSMRGKGYPLKTYMMHNPIPIIPGAALWFQKLFDKGTLKPGQPVRYTVRGLGVVCALKSTYKHNMFCPPAVRARLEGYKYTNPNLYELWTLGNYAKLEGVILKNWDVVAAVPEGVESWDYGLDFGFSIDPAALVHIWGNSTDIWVKGLIYNVGYTNQKLGSRMREEGVEDYDPITADSAEPKSIEYLYSEAGFRGISGVKKKPNYKVDMANTLNSYKIHLIEGDINLQREFSMWSWARDKEGRQLPKVADGNDHYIDAMIMRMHARKGSSNMSVGDASLY